MNWKENQIDWIEEEEEKEELAEWLEEDKNDTFGRSPLYFKKFPWNFPDKSKAKEVRDRMNKILYRGLLKKLNR